MDPPSGEGHRRSSWKGAAVTVTYDQADIHALVEDRSVRNGLQTPVGLLGTGLYAPERTVTNEEISRGLDTSDEWIRARTGIRERRFASSDEPTSEMCVRAARQALERSGTRAEEIDAIVVSSITPDQPLPSTALMVAEALGTPGAMLLDLNQLACAGSVYGLLLGAHLLQNTMFRRVLVLGAEALSQLTDPLDRTTRVFFGDGAGAAVLGPVADGYGLLSWDTGGLLSHAVEVPAGGSSRPASTDTVRSREHFLKMDGRAVWTEATTSLPISVTNALTRAGLSILDIDHFFFHQANRVMLEEIARKLGIPADRAPLALERYGNTGSASIFTVLEPAMAAGTVRDGDLMVLSGIGAGFLWATVCLRYQAPA